MLNGIDGAGNECYRPIKRDQLGKKDLVTGIKAFRWPCSYILCYFSCLLGTTFLNMCPFQ